MINQEIYDKQDEYAKCVNEYLDKNLFTEKNFISTLKKKCTNKVSEVYLPIIEKEALNHRLYTSTLVNKLNTAFLNVAKYGYNSHLCKSL